MLQHQAVNDHSEYLPQRNKITGEQHINLLVKTFMHTRQGIQRVTESKGVSKKYFA